MQCTDNIRSSASTGRTWLSPDGFATKCVLLANIFCMRMLYMPLDCTIMIKVKLKGLYISNMVSLLFHLCNRDFGMHGSVEYTFVSSNQWHQCLGIIYTIELPFATSILTLCCKIQSLYIMIQLFFNTSSRVLILGAFCVGTNATIPNAHPCQDIGGHPQEWRWQLTSTASILVHPAGK